ncbi:hypothetical protein Tco_0646704 [Tanacetum coccineum]
MYIKINYNGFGDVSGSGINNSGLSHDESFKVNDLDLNLNIIETQTKLHVLEVLVFEEADVGRIEVPVSEEADVGRTEVPVFEEVDVGRTEEHVVEQVIVEEVVDGSFEEDVEQGNGQEAVEAHSDEQVNCDVEGIDNAYETLYHVDISKDVPFDNIGVTNLFPDDVLKGEDVDVVNLDGFDGDTCNDNETSNYRRKSAKEAKNRVYLHSIESRRILKLYKNDNVRVRARCEGKVNVFSMSQGTGPTGPKQGMCVGHSGSSGLRIRSKKRKNTSTNDDSQTCSSALDAHDKGDLCSWVLKIKHYTYTFLAENIFDQVKVNTEIPAKDTDLERSTKESEEAVLRDFYWLGLTRDEGPGDAGDDYDLGMFGRVERNAKKRKENDFLCLFDTKNGNIDGVEVFTLVPSGIHITGPVSVNRHDA